MSLSERDREILQTWLESWTDADMPLAGDISYADVGGLIERLKLSAPRALAQILNIKDRS